MNPQNITKRYYKIGEVAEMFDVATSLIRYWESEFKQLKPLKSKSGIR
ncbi:MAG: MerR family DNA-binding transcriptional regulator, partial [Saprospiraceae bacterium]